MTGKEFYEIIHNAKEITEIGWQDYGEDCSNPDRTTLVAKVDGKYLEITLAKETDSEHEQVMSYTSIAMLLNKFFELIDDRLRIRMKDHISEIAFYAMMKDAERSGFDNASFEDTRADFNFPYKDIHGKDYERWVDSLPDDQKW